LTYSYSSVLYLPWQVVDIKIKPGKTIQEFFHMTTAFAQIKEELFIGKWLFHLFAET